MATLCSDHVKLSDIKWASHFLGQWGFRNWGLQPIEMQDAEVMRWPGDSAHYLCCLNWNIYTNIYVHVDIQYSHLDHINIASRHQHYQHAFTKPNKQLWQKTKSDFRMTSLVHTNWSRHWPHATKYLDVNGSLEQKNGSLGI